MYKNILCGIIFLFTYKAYSLVPLESALLGDLTQKYSEEVDNPMNYIFKTEISPDSDSLSYVKELSIFRGFYFEGKNLDNSCKKSKRPKYTTSWQEVQVKRSFLATLQYIGLDLTSRALPKYAKHFGFSKEDYVNLVHNIVGNYCSKNISIMGRSQLIKNFIIQYDSSIYKLPTIENNPLFTKEIANLGDITTNRKKEFYYTLDIFKRSCSWGGEHDEARLLVPFLKNPSIYSFVVRQMSNRSLKYDEKKDRVLSSHNKNTVQVICENLICRKVNSQKFWTKIHFSVGSDNLEHDLQRLYCSSFRDLQYKYKGRPKKIVDYIKKTGLDEEVFGANHFLTLLTGIPDFLLRANRFSDIRNFSKSSMDRSWSHWANIQNMKHDKTIQYEESITIELSDRKHYFNPKKRAFGVEFEVNLGEYDRITQRLGKVRAGFRLKVSKKLLRWAISNWSERSAREVILARKEVKKRLRNSIAPQVKNAQKKFLRSPWKGDLTRLIIKELTTQFVKLKARNYKVTDAGYEVIPVKIHYGNFALKYLNYKNKVETNQKRDQYLSSIFDNK